MMRKINFFILVYIFPTTYAQDYPEYGVSVKTVAEDLSISWSIDWDRLGNLVATEHGPSGWKGIAHDEINLIVPDTNYGWPNIIGDETAEGLKNPIFHTGNDTWAPSGAEFYYENKISQWTGKYFVTTLRGNHLHMIDFDLENKTVISHEKLFQGEFGRLRDVATGPDGFLYILTSNRDGRD
jgi:glucose/arabinose dehydrogenase